MAKPIVEVTIRDTAHGGKGEVIIRLTERDVPLPSETTWTLKRETATEIALGLLPLTSNTSKRAAEFDQIADLLAAEGPAALQTIPGTLAKVRALLAANTCAHRELAVLKEAVNDAHERLNVAKVPRSPADELISRIDFLIAHRDELIARARPLPWVHKPSVVVNDGTQRTLVPFVCQFCGPDARGPLVHVAERHGGLSELGTHTRLMALEAAVFGSVPT